jgi:hypothetical protein
MPLINLKNSSFFPLRFSSERSKPIFWGIGISAFHCPGNAMRIEEGLEVGKDAHIPSTSKNSPLLKPLLSKSNEGGPDIATTSARWARVL